MDEEEAEEVKNRFREKFGETNIDSSIEGIDIVGEHDTTALSINDWPTGVAPRDRYGDPVAMFLDQGDDAFVFAQNREGPTIITPDLLLDSLDFLDIQYEEAINHASVHEDGGYALCLEKNGLVVSIAPRIPSRDNSLSECEWRDALNQRPFRQSDYDKFTDIPEVGEVTARSIMDEGILAFNQFSRSRLMDVDDIGSMRATSLMNYVENRDP